MVEEDISKINAERILVTASLEEPDQVPVSLLVVGDWCAWSYGVNERQAYFCPDTLLDAMLTARRKFHGLVSIKPDFSVVIEPSALGSKIRWPEDTTPWAIPFIETAEDVDRLEVPDPYRDGLMAASLEVYRYMKRRIQEMGLKINVEMPYGLRGPFTLGGMLAGLERLIQWLYRRPETAHLLLRKCTETVVTWGRTQREASGSSFPVFLADDYSGFLSPKLFKEFSLLYIQDVFKPFNHPLNTYHNDAQTSQLLQLLPETGMKIFHMGSPRTVSLRTAKKEIGDRVCLMGNVDPLKTLTFGTPEEVERQCREAIEEGAPSGGFILAPGGVVGRGMPAENVKILIEAAEKHGKYPLSALRT